MGWAPWLDCLGCFSAVPEAVEAIGRQVGVDDGVLDVPVAQVVLDGPGVLAVVGQLEPENQLTRSLPLTRRESGIKFQFISGIEFQFSARMLSVWFSQLSRGDLTDNVPYVRSGDSAFARPGSRSGDA